MSPNGSNRLHRFLCNLIIVLILFVQAFPLFVHSHETIITTVVPSHCQLQVDIVGRGVVSINEKAIRSSIILLVPRLSQTIIDIQPGIGYQIATISLNGIDITSKLHSGKLTLDGISSDSILSVFFARRGSVWPGSNPPTTDSISSSIICCAASALCLLILQKRKQ